MDIKSIKDKSDINKLVDLFIKVFSEPPYNETWTKELAFERLSETYENCEDFCLYIEDQGKVIGLIVCDTQTWHDGVHIFIEDVIVDPNYRNKGIGSKLLKKLEEIAKKKNIVSIDLLSNTKSKAIGFWKKNNYKPNGYIELMKRI